MRRACVGLGLVGAAAVVPLTVARATGGDTSPAAAALAGLSSFAAGPLLLALGLVLLGRAWRLAAVPAALLAVHLLWLAPVLVPDRQPPAAAGTDRTVLGLNLHVGAADPAALVAAVRERRVDVLVLVELTPSAVTALRAAGLDGELPFAVLRDEPGSSGAGIWSRTPLVDGGNVPGTTWPAPIARVAASGAGELTVVAVHATPPQYDGGPSWRSDGAALAAWVRAGPVGPGGRLVLAGDFNAGPEHRPLQGLLAAGVSDAVDVVGLASWPDLTWPADRPELPPLLRIDHVLVSPGTVVVRDVGTLRIPGTDHLGVLAGLADADRSADG